MYQVILQENIRRLDERGFVFQSRLDKKDERPKSHLAFVKVELASELGHSILLGFAHSPLHEVRVHQCLNSLCISSYLVIKRNGMSFRNPQIGGQVQDSLHILPIQRGSVGRSSLWTHCGRRRSQRNNGPSHQLISKRGIRCSPIQNFCFELLLVGVDAMDKFLFRNDGLLATQLVNFCPYLDISKNRVEIGHLQSRCLLRLLRSCRVSCGRSSRVCR